MDDAGMGEFVSFDNGRVCEKQLTVKECVQIAREYVRRRNNRRMHLRKEKKLEKTEKEKEKEESGNDVGEEGAEAVGLKKVAGKQVMKGLDLLKTLFKQEGVDVRSMKALKAVEETVQKVVNNSRVQTNMSDYFSKDGSDGRDGIHKKEEENAGRDGGAMDCNKSVTDDDDDDDYYEVGDLGDGEEWGDVEEEMGVDAEAGEGDGEGEKETDDFNDYAKLDSIDRDYAMLDNADTDEDVDIEDDENKSEGENEDEDGGSGDDNDND
jgi:hypothetical protein